ncbi:MAG: bifunctional pyr operon transcriptional regulator/uracil phosphoribosyltransferase PyrR [Acidimicrobiales bacterium]
MTEIGRSDASRHGSFVPRAQLLSADDITRALRRIAHEILERNSHGEAMVIIGLQTGGVAFAKQLAYELDRIGEKSVALGSLDVAFYRDDLNLNPLRDASTTSIPVDLDGRTVVLVDDVLFTGRTIRAALNALAEWGRPTSIQLVVMVDRGHRELPIRPDFVGKNLPTSQHEAILANIDGVWIGSEEKS